MPDFPSGLGTAGYPVWVTGSVATGISLSGSFTIGSVTADQGSPNLLADAWPMKITDGNNVLGDITSPLAVILTSGSQALGGDGNSPIWVTGSVAIASGGGGGGANVTLQSGSVTGLLVGGQNVSAGNPVPVSGSLSVVFPPVQTITGSVSLAVAPTVLQGTSPWVTSVNNFPATQTSASGSVTGLLVGGNPASMADPLPVTGSVAVINFPATQLVAGTVTVSQGISGTIPWQITGSVGIASSVAINNYPAVQPITGSVALTVAPTVLQGTSPWAVTGTVGIAASVAINNFPSTQILASGSVTGLLVGGDPVSNANQVPVTGSVTLTNAPTVLQGTSPWITSLGSTVINSGSISGLLVGGQPVSNNNPVPVAGTVVVASTVINSGSITGLLAGGVVVSNANPLPVEGTIVVASTVINSGSITGMLVGGQPVSNNNPVPITGSVGITSAIAISNFPATQTVGGTVNVNQGTPTSLVDAWPVMLVSGSETIGGNSGTPIWVTGSVGLTNGSAGGSGGNVTAQSGSVTGLLYGGVAASAANPFWVTGSVGITNGGGGGGGTVTQGPASVLPNAWPVLLASGSEPIGVLGTPLYVTGTVGIAASVAVNNFPTSTVIDSGSVTGLLYGGVAASAGNPVWITGSVGLTNGSGGGSGGNVTVQSGSVTGLLVGGNPLELSNPIPVTGSISLTNAPTVLQGTSPWVTSLASTVINSGSVTGLLYGGVAASAGNPIWITGSVGLTNGSGGSGGNVTVQSGSVTGLLVGGNPLELSNPIPVINVSGSEPIGVNGTPFYVTGSVGIAASVAINNFPASQTVTLTSTVINSGSITGLLQGGQAVSANNPIWITGSVGLTNGSGGGGTVTTQSGSVAGLLYGGVAASAANPFWVTGSVGLTNGGGSGGNVTVQSGSVTGLLVGGNPLELSNPIPVINVSGSEPIGVNGTPFYVTGSVGIASSVAVNNFPTSTVINSGSVTGLLYGGVAASAGNPIWITGSVGLTNGSGGGGTVTVQSGSVTGLLLGGQPVSNTNPLSVNLSEVGGVAVIGVAKGTQPLAAVGVQDLKDSGRSHLTLSYTNATSATTTTVTTLTTLVQNSAFVSSTGVTTFLVPNGQTLRLLSLGAVGSNNSSTTSATSPQCIHIEVRVATTNTTTAAIAAPIAMMLGVPITANAVGISNSNYHCPPDGVEVPAGNYVSITIHNNVTTVNTTLTNLVLNGFLY